ncbi:hypothetical protein PIROE2DRAFT_16332 [Piromyces sp. E2]|nr:hypothetical protein PIROE2DRAFT_16332 [Piromyces sp. E2]|eukprot:OUM58403.1 hypothetical protein PIROE2DRAFT_16332 [Piromyces sp. E2]
MNMLNQIDNDNRVEESQNPFDEERRNIFGNVYLANVRNRLRELENPNDVDCQRWVWELVQNAKDSIAGSPDRTSVDIEIIIDEEKYIFRHNGSPFTFRNLTALLYKFSNGKTNDCESTGRFGTGFLTTHCLSKIVKISGEVIPKQKSEPQGFTVTMFREGEDEELLKGLEKTEESYQSPIDSDGWTTYEYEAVTKRNKEAGKLGIENFKNNIDKVMLFCHEINSIKLVDNGEEYTIDRGEIVQDLDGNCQILSLHITDSNENKIKRFLYTTVNEYNEPLTKKFGKERNIRICCALELDENNNISVNNCSPNLFCSLPLVGSEPHKLPFIINSPDFEPDSERQAILLDGKEINEKTQKLSDPGVNKMILGKAQEMYRNLLDYICRDNTIGKRYQLTRGLCYVPHVTRFFDDEWYMDNFIKPMRDILLEYPIVWKGNGYIRLTEVHIPQYSNHFSKDTKKEVYDFMSKLYDGVVPEFVESLLIESNIWKNDSRLTYINIKKCIEKVKDCGTVDQLALIISNPWEWLDEFLVFIKFHYSSYLESYAIIPNMNSKFVPLTNNLASSEKVPENIIQCIEKLGITWRDDHIHKNIIQYTSGTDHDIDIAVSKIRGCLKEWSDHILTLMHYIPYDQDQEFIEKREEIYEFCSVVYGSRMEDKKNGNEFPKELWNGIDDMIFKHLIDNISNYGKLDDKYTIDFMIKFLKCVSRYYPSYRYSSLVPNQNGKFCMVDSLYEDDSIPEVFKECLKVCFNRDIKNELLDQRMLPIKHLLQRDKKCIYSYNYDLKHYFNLPETQYTYHRRGSQLNKEYVSLDNKIKAAKYLIKIIPEENSSFESQRELFNLYKTFSNAKYEPIEIECNYQISGIWEYSNKYIYQIIRKVIEKYSNLTTLANYLNKSNEETLDCLSRFLHFSKEGKIILNQNNVFCYLEQLKNDESFGNEFLPEKLKDIAKLLNYDVRSLLVHKHMGRPCIFGVLLYKELCLKIDTLIKEKYDIPSNHSNSDYKEASRGLIEEYFIDIGDDKAKENFPSTYSLKDQITLNVIFNREIRQNITKFGKMYGNGALTKIIENPEVMQELINGELSDGTYIENKKRVKVFEDAYGKEAFNKLLENPEIVNKIVKGDLSDTKYHTEIEYLQSLERKYGDGIITKLMKNKNILQMLDNDEITDDINESSQNNKAVVKHDDTFSEPTIISDSDGCNQISISFRSTIRSNNETMNFYKEYIGYLFNNGNNSVNRRTGRCGEAYIYEYLCNTGLYKNVTWNMLSSDGQGELLEYNNKEYRIIQDGAHHDIVVETNDNRKIYIEVKSTRYSFGNKVPFFLSEQQIYEMQKTLPPNEYLLAIVFDVMNHPKHFFMSLKNKII